MANKKIEVNDVERAEIEPSESEEEEEVITKPEDIEEKETPSDSSTEEKPGETTEEEEGEEGEEKGEKLVTHDEEEPSESEEDKGFVEPSKEEISDEIKRLPNETPVEFARRLEILRIKRDNRRLRKEELMGGKSEITQTQYNELDEEENKLLGQYDQAELSTFEKILSVLAKKHGWVKREELNSTTKSQLSNDILDDFLKFHPEYSPENDKDNVLWNEFKSQFQLYKIPENPRDLKRIFNKIHSDIFGVKSEDGLRKISAQKEKLKVVSHSGGSAQRGQSSSKGTKLTPDQRQHFKGFSENDFEELGL